MLIDCIIYQKDKRMCILWCVVVNELLNTTNIQGENQAATLVIVLDNDITIGDVWFSHRNVGLIFLYQNVR